MGKDNPKSNVSEQEFNVIKYLLSIGKSTAEICKATNRSKWVISHVNNTNNLEEYKQRSRMIKSTDRQDDETAQNIHDEAVRMSANYQFNRISKQIDQINEQLELIQRTMVALLDVWKEG